MTTPLSDAFFEKLVADSWERPLPSLTRRDLRPTSIPGKAEALVGVRRSGKTSILFQEMADRLSAGDGRDQLLYVDFEDERLLPLEASDLHRIPDALFRLNPDLRSRECTLLFDEVQNVPGWERFVRRLLDTERVRVLLTGSSSKLLGREIATSLRGRSLSTEVLPFGFRESLRHAGIVPPEGPAYGAKQRSLLENKFGGFLETGGFPEVLTLTPEERLRVLRDYADVALFRDVVERHGVTNVPVLRRLVRQLLGAPACLFSVHKFYNALKSEGFRIAKDSLHEYLDHLEEAGLVFPVPLHSRSERARQVNPRKVYPVDVGLSSVFCPHPGEEAGRQLETVVYLELRRRGFQAEYYRTGSGREVDFIARRPPEEARLVQVCLSARERATRQRETEALSEAMSELGLSEAWLLTLGDESDTTPEDRRIRLLPAWRWTLEGFV